MTRNESIAKREQELTEAAWARLEQRLQTAEASPLWQQWAEQGEAVVGKRQEESGVEPASPIAAADGQAHAARRHNGEPNEQINQVPLGRTRPSHAPASGPRKQGEARRWLRRHAGKTAAACAAAVITVVIAIPSTNEALAAWLNTFRMDDVMVVQEDDLQSLMYSFAGSGEKLERVNRFGSFENTSVGSTERITPEQAADRLGFELPAITVADYQIVEVNAVSAQSFTFRLNVEEINGAMRKLGADKLLPQSVDGKAITFDTGSGIQVSYRQAEESGQKESVWVSYSQSPSVQVDPSVDVKDAFEAVIRFPALPEHLRKTLQRASNLENGKVPLPIVTNQQPEHINVGGIDVYLEIYAESRYTNAIWMQNGTVASAGFNGFQDRKEIEAIIAELVQP